MTNTYQSEFTRENVRDLANHLHKSIKTYADERGKPLDLFVIAAALQQSTYEIVLRSLSESKEEGEKKIDQMKPISVDIIKAVDTYREQNKSMPTEELLAAIFASNLLVEFYAHNRDMKLEALQQLNGQEVGEDLEKEKTEQDVVEQDVASESTGSAE